MSLQDQKEEEFMSLSQGDMSVFEYESKFVELEKYAPHIQSDDKRRTKKFIKSSFFRRRLR